MFLIGIEPLPGYRERLNEDSEIGGLWKKNLKSLIKIGTPNRGNEIGRK